MPDEPTTTKPTVRIIDTGRGPQIEGHRLTVMDVFYYLHRGYDFEFIHQCMPSLRREEFDAVVEYVGRHHDELVEADRRVEEFHRRGQEAQWARGGIFAEQDENLTLEERVARLKKIMEQRKAEKNGARHPD
jgi:uncharacterized protein (DUF433 family)